MSDKNIIVQGDYYEQNGNFGAGHVSGSEILGETQLGGIINEAKQNTKTNQQEIEQKTNTKKTERTTRYLAVTISGEIEETSLNDLLKIQAELVSKLKNININIVDVEKGSIKLIFEGSEEDLEQLKALIQSGELTEVSGKTIENANIIDAETEETELRNKIDIRNNLAQEIRSHNVERRKLAKVNLKLCNLREIFLVAADLSYADLSYANLSYANLSYADLSYTDLSYTDLSYTDLSYTDLSYADLKGSDLSNADLRNANLRNADLGDAYLMRGVYLRGADLRNADLRNADLRNANLRNANLSGADLRNANLSGADLRDFEISDETKIDDTWWRKVWQIVNQPKVSGLNLRDANREPVTSVRTNILISKIAIFDWL